MTSSLPLAEFKFQNLDYELINQAKNEVYVNIEREFRTAPFIGMKQPTPVGGMLGLEAILKVKHEGKLAIGYQWKLYVSNQLIQSGTTDEKGQSGDLNIIMAYGVHTTYELLIFPPPPQEPGDGIVISSST